MFVIYKDILKENDKFYLKKEVVPIPVEFIISKKFNENLQKAFSYAKKLLIQSKLFTLLTL